ncbi:MAG: HAD hydrolase-like protein [Natrialbaceae archaeon]|nr:HAD hydrolase-like protein [Natrialbaceae archaeon]
MLLSNNPTRTGEHYREVFAETAVDIESIPILTSATISARILADTHADESGYLIGEPALETILTDAGISITRDPAAAEYLLASLDPTFSYDTLRAAQNLLDRGVPFYGTDPIPVFPAKMARFPARGRSSPHSRRQAADRRMRSSASRPLKQPEPHSMPSRCPPPKRSSSADRLDTDIELGRQAGLTTVLVQSDVTDSEAAGKADHVLGSIGDLDTVLE